MLKRWTPLLLLGVAQAAASVLGQAGVLVVMLGLAAAIVLWRRQVRHDEKMLLADFVEHHAFPSDTIEDFAKSATGAVSLEEARARMESWRSGWRAAEHAAYVKRSLAARRGRRPKT